jgi:hypothetical protein
VGIPYQISSHAFLLPVGSTGIAAINLKGAVDLADIISDHNVFYVGPNDPVVLWTNPPPGMPTSMTFAEWQAMGQDLNSQAFDPADPVVAANMDSYRARDLAATPPLVLTPCCARFLFCTGDIPGHPCPDPDQPTFLQHLASKAGPAGWSDPLSYDTMITQTFCGDCGRDGLLATMP